MDNQGNFQPRKEMTIWNWKGYMNNAIHEVKVWSTIQKGKDPQTSP